MPQTFSLHIAFSSDDDDNDEILDQLNERMQRKTTDESTCCAFIAHAMSCRISHSQNANAQYAVVFVPATIVDELLQIMVSPLTTKNVNYLDENETRTASDHFGFMIHPSLSVSPFPLIKAILPIRNQYHAPSDLILLDLSQKSILDGLLHQCHVCKMPSGRDVVVKTLLIDHVINELLPESVLSSPSTAVPSPPPISRCFDIPNCPVCLHRIDPPRLGWSLPLNNMCSRSCPPPDLVAKQGESSSCPNQRLLEPWPRPSCCAACRVIQTCWSSHNYNDDAKEKDIACVACGMKETLWLCLTCAFIGCGRYSNKHAAQHFRDSGHPFCLELTTLRIWDYSFGEGGFAHRVDLLECPSSPPLMSPWIQVASAAGHAVEFSDMDSNDVHGPEKSSKKATMIGEEYETLLQSALEEQAQHYEGEISRLRAELAASVVKRASLSDMEQAEVDHNIAQNDALRAKIESTKRSILELQSQEAPLRAASNRLLREQQIAKDLLQQVQEETRQEQIAGKLQVDELEQQIADLTTNQRMREQFTQDHELQNAQIFGTTGNDNSAKKVGKKTRRFARK